jgi:hypothetical protein
MQIRCESSKGPLSHISLILLSLATQYVIVFEDDIILKSLSITSKPHVKSNLHYFSLKDFLASCHSCCSIRTDSDRVWPRDILSSDSYSQLWTFHFLQSFSGRKNMKSSRTFSSKQYLDKHKYLRNWLLFCGGIAHSIPCTAAIFWSIVRPHPSSNHSWFSHKSPPVSISRHA